MVAAHPEDTFHFFFDRAYDKKYVFADNVKPYVLHPQARHPWLWHMWFEWAVPSQLTKIKADVFFSGDMYLSLKTKVPTVMVSHDLNYEHHPEYLKASHAKYMLNYSSKFHKKAKHLIAVSETTKQDIITTYNIPADNITVAGNAVPSNFEPATSKQRVELEAKYTDGCPYFIYIGSLHPRKNVKRLVEAFELFKLTTKRSHKLVIFGQTAFKTGDIFNYHKTMRHKGDVRFLTDKNANVYRLLAGAEALCYVSLFEGFGIPILEAFSCKVPVITSNVSSMPEVAGKGALLVDPYSPQMIAQAMKQLSDNSPLNNKLTALGEQQLKKYSWDRSAETVYQALVEASR